MSLKYLVVSIKDLTRIAMATKTSLIMKRFQIDVVAEKFIRIERQNSFRIHVTKETPLTLDKLKIPNSPVLVGENIKTKSV